jgi:hypothetical protein
MATNYVLVDFENVQPDMSALAGTANRVIVFFGAKQQTSRHHFDKFDSLLDLGANLERVKVPYSGKNALDMHIAFQIGRIFEKDPGASFLVLSKDTDFDPLIEYLKAKGVSISRSKDVGALAAGPPPAMPAMGAVPRKSRGSGTARKPQGQKSQPQKVPPSARAPQSQKVAQPPKMPPLQKSAQAQKPQPQKPAQPKVQVETKALPIHFEQIVKQLRSMSGKPSTRKKLEQTIASYFKHHGGERPENEVGQAVEELIRRGLVAQAGTRVTYQLG